VAGRLHNARQQRKEHRVYQRRGTSGLVDVVEASSPYPQLGNGKRHLIPRRGQRRKLSVQRTSLPLGGAPAMPPDEGRTLGERIASFCEAILRCRLLCVAGCEKCLCVTKAYSTTTRVLTVAKGQESLSTVVETNNGASTSSTADLQFKGRVKKEASYYRIDFLMDQMKLHRTADIQSLKTQVIKDEKTWSIWKEMQASPNFDQLCKKAVELYRTERCAMTFDQMIVDYQKFRFTRIQLPEFYEPRLSKRLFERWLREQGFDKMEFLEDLYNVLHKKKPKKNTFVLQGAPNAGKSWILRSLVPLFMFFGEVRAGDSYNFMWQDCLDSAPLFIEEIMVTDKIVEQCKLIFEGADTYVHVKMKGDALLSRTPVLITCNSPIWKWCMQEKEALKVRMYVRYCKTMPWLKHFKKRLDPLTWAELFREYRQYKACQPLSTGDIEEFENSQPTEEELQMLRTLEEVEGTVMTEEILTKEKDRFNHYQSASNIVDDDQDGGNKLPVTPPAVQVEPIGFDQSPDLFGPDSPTVIPDTPQKPTLKRTFSQFFPPSQSTLSADDIFDGTLTSPRPKRNIQFENNYYEVFKGDAPNDNATETDSDYLRLITR